MLFDGQYIYPRGDIIVNLETSSEFNTIINRHRGKELYAVQWTG